MKEVETEQKHEEETNLSVRDEQMHEETGPKQVEVENQNPNCLHTKLYFLVKKMCHTGPCFGLIPIKMLKEGCSIWKIKRGIKMRANSRPVDNVETFKFEKKFTVNSTSLIRKSQSN